MMEAIICYMSERIGSQSQIHNLFDEAAGWGYRDEISQ
jgi:hypothetical protein